MSAMKITNLVRSPEDKRDFQYVAAAPALPAKVDLRMYAGAIEDQSSIGSCTANATCSALELMTQRAGRFEDLSRLFLYYETRLLENRVGQEGAFLRDALKVANKTGLPAESVWPYDLRSTDVQPSAEAYEDAKKRMLTRYEAVPLATLSSGLGFWDAINNLKAALAEGLPVIIAMTVYEPIFHVKGPLEQQTYEYYKADGTYEKDVGNHAVTLVGYDDEHGYFIYENSWGTTWGDNGYGAIRYGVLGSVIFEAWVVRGFNGIEIVKPEPNPVPVPVPPAPVPVPDPVEPPAPGPQPYGPKVVERANNSAAIIAVAAVAALALAKAMGVF